MIDLMHINALLLTQPKQKQARESFLEGYNLALFKRVEDTEMLRLEADSNEVVDLDDALVWRQKKVKEKAIQLFTMLSGDNIKARVINLAIAFLAENETISTSNFKQYLVVNGYSEKTAAAQSSQMVTLFKLLKVTNAQGEINPRSLVWRRILEHKFS